MRSRLQALRASLAREMGSEIEVTPAIRLITLERFLKATVLIAGGITLLVAGSRTDLHRAMQDLQTQLNLTTGRSWWQRLAQAIVVRFGMLSRAKQDLLAIGAMLYGGLEAFEGIGLLLRRRWAEYLVVIATGAFLPIEIEELFRKPTIFKALAFAVNVLIIVYLVWRKRLFFSVFSRDTKPA